MKRLLQICIPALMVLPLACKTPNGGDASVSTPMAIGMNQPAETRTMRLIEKYEIDNDLYQVIRSASAKSICFGKMAGGQVQLGYGLFPCNQASFTEAQVVSLIGEEEFTKVDGCTTCGNWYRINFSRYGVQVGFAVAEKQKDGSVKISLNRLCTDDFQSSCDIDFNQTSNTVTFKLLVEGDPKKDVKIRATPENPYYIAYVKAQEEAKRIAEQKRRAAEEAARQAWLRDPMNQPFWQQAKTETQKWYARTFINASPINSDSQLIKNYSQIFTCTFIDGRPGETANNWTGVQVEVTGQDRIISFAPLGTGTFSPEARVRTSLAAGNYKGGASGILWVRKARLNYRDGYIVVHYEESTNAIIQYGQCV